VRRPVCEKGDNAGRNPGCQLFFFMANYWPLGQPVPTRSRIGLQPRAPHDRVRLSSVPQGVGNRNSTAWLRRLGRLGRRPATKGIHRFFRDAEASCAQRTRGYSYLWTSRIRARMEMSAPNTIKITRNRTGGGSPGVAPGIGPLT
jgi:hypothetical protein